MERPKEYETRLKSRIVVENIISQTAQEQGWRLQARVPDIIRQLALESEKLDCHGEVFPVFVQIFLKQAEQSIEGRTTAEFPRRTSRRIRSEPRRPG